MDYETYCCNKKTRAQRNSRTIKGYKIDRYCNKCKKCFYVFPYDLP